MQISESMARMAVDTRVALVRTRCSAQNEKTIPRVFTKCDGLCEAFRAILRGFSAYEESTSLSSASFFHFHDMLFEKAYPLNTSLGYC